MKTEDPLPEERFGWEDLQFLWAIIKMNKRQKRQLHMMDG